MPQGVDRIDNSDRPLLDLIRRRGPLTVAEMAGVLDVTPTAVRNRLTRLVSSGLVERQTEHGKRGRPRHTYQASAEAQKRLGQNYADLAVVLWEEMMRTIEDRKLRRALFGRITERLAEQYRAGSAARTGSVAWSSSARSCTTAGSRPRSFREGTPRACRS